MRGVQMQHPSERSKGKSQGRNIFPGYYPELVGLNSVKLNPKWGQDAALVGLAWWRAWGSSNHSKNSIQAVHPKYLTFPQRKVQMPLFRELFSYKEKRKTIINNLILSNSSSLLEFEV
jgi:hypothetical protein